MWALFEVAEGGSRRKGSRRARSSPHASGPCARTWRRLPAATQPLSSGGQPAGPGQVGRRHPPLPTGALPGHGVQPGAPEHPAAPGVRDGAGGGPWGGVQPLRAQRGWPLSLQPQMPAALPCMRAPPAAAGCFWTPGRAGSRVSRAWPAASGVWSLNENQVCGRLSTCPRRRQELERQLASGTSGPPGARLPEAGEGRRWSLRGKGEMGGGRQAAGEVGSPVPSPGCSAVWSRAEASLGCTGVTGAAPGNRQVPDGTEGRVWGRGRFGGAGSGLVGVGGLHPSSPGISSAGTGPQGALGSGGECAGSPGVPGRGHPRTHPLDGPSPVASKHRAGETPGALAGLGHRPRPGHSPSPPSPSPVFSTGVPRVLGSPRQSSTGPQVPSGWGGAG